MLSQTTLNLDIAVGGESAMEGGVVGGGTVMGVRRDEDGCRQSTPSSSRVGGRRSW